MRSDFDDGEQVGVDMAPLIDCVFLLLIFFLVATTMKRIDEELPLDLPEAAAAIEVTKATDMLVFSIDATGLIHRNADPIGATELIEIVKQQAADDPDMRIRIDADRQTPYEAVLRVIDTCMFYGLKNIGLHTRRDTTRHAKR
ncbi:MAG: biopolymer transporter ExbD [Planctomycetota bacterium]|jgi:biopolymer transport protein ExbD|nr:biopolymer transporter ExbD [Planctomycetota bacterium]